MLARRAALAVVTSASFLVTMGAAAVACSQSYAAADAPADATADVAQELDSGIVADALMTPDAGGDGVATSGVTVLASGYSALTSIATDDKNVYFSEQGTGGIHAIAIVGPPAVSDLAQAGAPTSIAVADGFVYWTDPASSTVGRVSTLGGPTTKTASSADTPADIAVTMGRVVDLTVMGASGSGYVEQLTADLAGPPAQTTLVVNPFLIAASGTTIYWTEGAPSNTVASALVGSTTRTVVATDPDAESIATDDAGAVYWASAAAGAIRTQTTAGAVQTIVTMEQVPKSLAVDGSGIYWLTQNGLLRRKRLGQELPPETLASGFLTPLRTRVRGVALTSSYVVWLTEDGRVLRVVK